MKRNSLLLKTLAVFLSLSFSLPNPAFALRSVEPKQSGVEEEMASSLGRSQSTAAGAEEAVFNEAVSILKLRSGKGAIRSGMWASLMETLEGEDPGFLKKLIADPNVEFTAPVEQRFRARNLMKGNGARAKLIGDIKRSRELAEETVRKRAEQLRKQISEKALEALRQLKNSGLQNFSALRDAMKGSPAAEEWNALIDRLELSVGQQKGQGIEDPLIFSGLVQRLNQEWFVPRENRFLFPDHRDIGESLNHLVFQDLARPVQWHVLEGESIPVYFVRIPQQSTEFAAKWLSNLRIIVVNLAWFDRIRAGWRQGLSTLASVAAEPDRAFVASIIQVLERQLKKRYANAEEFSEAWLEGIIAEELRHALDHLRVEKHVKKKLLYMDYAGYAAAHLAPPANKQPGIFWKIFENQLADAWLTSKKGEAADLQWRWVRVVQEISGQMSRVKRDSHIALLDWLVAIAMVQGKSRQAEEHYIAAMAAVRLLGNRVEPASSTRFAPETWMGALVGYRDVYALAFKLAEMPSEELQSDIQQIFEREFNSPFEDPAFEPSVAAPPATAGAEEKAEQIVEPGAIAGFDASTLAMSDEENDSFLEASRQQMNRNVLALLKYLQLPEASTRVVNIGSWLRPLILPSPWPAPVNVDPYPLAQKASDQVQAPHLPIDLKTAIAQKVFDPGQPDSLPDVLLLHEMHLYADSQFWKDAWAVVHPGGWFLLTVDPKENPEIKDEGHRLALTNAYKAFIGATSGGLTPAEVRRVRGGPSQEFLAVAIRKPAAAGAEEQGKKRKVKQVQEVGLQRLLEPLQSAQRKSGATVRFFDGREGPFVQIPPEGVRFDWFDMMGERAVGGLRLFTGGKEGGDQFLRVFSQAVGEYKRVFIRLHQKKTPDKSELIGTIADQGNPGPVQYGGVVLELIPGGREVLIRPAGNEPVYLADSLMLKSSPTTAGAEEGRMRDFLNVLDEAAPQGPWVLVIEVGAISQRVGLAEFVARVPRKLAGRMILFGSESAEAKELAARNGITVVDSDKLSDLAFQLMLLGEEAGRIGFLGNPVAAAALSELLPRSMELTSLDPVTALDRLLLFLGYPDAVLGTINAAGAEELFARQRAA